MKPNRNLLILLLVIGLAVMGGCSDNKGNPQPTPTSSQPSTPVASASEGQSPEKIRQAVDQVTTIINNVNRWKAQKHAYKDLDSKRAVADGLVPAEMITDTGGIQNPWGGPVSIGFTPDFSSFTILFSSVPKADCAQLAMHGSFIVYAGNWGPSFTATTEEQAIGFCNTGNIWFLPK